MAAKKKAGRESWGIIDTLPSGRYRARYTHLGTRFTAPTTYTTKQAARSFLTGTRADIERGVWVDPRIVKESPLFGPFAEKWVAQRLTPKGSPLRSKTSAEYRRQLGNGLAPFRSMAFDDITSAFVREWHAARMLDGPTQAGAESRLLRAILNTAIEDGLKESNPVTSAMCKATTGKKYRPPTLAELGVICQAIEDRFKLAIIIAAYGSARISEWRALQRDSITFVEALYEGRVVEQAAVRIMDQAIHTTEKGWERTPTKSEEGERVVFLHPMLTPLVQEHLRRFVGKAKKALLFPSGTTQEYLPDWTFWPIWDRARQAAGITREVREHDLRKFAGTSYAQAGATLRETMKFMGHGTPAAAMIYQVDTGRGAELAARMPIPAALSIEMMRPADSMQI